MNQEFHFDDKPSTVFRKPPPSALFWFRLYVSVACLFFGSVIAFGIAMMAIAPSEWGKTQNEAILIGLPYLIVGAPLLFLHGITFFFPRRPWAWTYNIGLLTIGFFCCSLPASIAILILWSKPETQRYFDLNVK